MRLLVDANLSPRLAVSLRLEGHDAVHVFDIGLGDATDADVFARAASEGRILVTLDLEFGEVVALGARISPSVVLVRTRRSPARDLFERIGAALRKTETALAAGAIVIIEDARTRVRRLPIRAVVEE